MERVAIFPGSFDPFTVGHESIVKRAIPLFDKIVIMIGYNTNKRSFFPVEKRLRWINEVFKNEPSYYDWMMKGDFPLSTKRTITAIKLRGFNKA